MVIDVLWGRQGYSFCNCFISATLWCDDDAWVSSGLMASETVRELSLRGGLGRLGSSVLHAVRKYQR